MGSNKIINLTGQTFGRLTVLGFTYSKDEKPSWKCLCECGKHIIVQGGNLRRGQTQSCGCLKIEKIKERTANENHPFWTGDKVNYPAAHMWMKRHKPRPAFCQMCRERPALDLSFNGKNGDWTRNPEDYEWLCRGCHRLKDSGQPGVKPLTKARVHRIREFYRVGAANQKELANLFRVTPATISNIIRRVGIYQDVFEPRRA